MEPEELEGSDAMIVETHMFMILGIHLKPSVLCNHFCHLQLVLALVLLNALGDKFFLGCEGDSMGTSMIVAGTLEGGLPSTDLEALVGLEVFRFLLFRLRDKIALATHLS